MDTPEKVCNMVMVRLGTKPEINSISDPKTDMEKVFAVWFHPCRQTVLKKLKPNFALDRKVIAQSSVAPAFGYAYAYQKPTLCLEVCGIGDVQDKKNNYSVEGEYIFTDEDYEDGMELRYVKDITDISKFTIDCILALISELMDKLSLAITQDPKMLQIANGLIKNDNSSASALNAQENPPVRKNVSKFKLAKFYDNPTLTNKK